MNQVFTPLSLYFVSLITFILSACSADSDEIPTLTIDPSKHTQIKLADLQFEPVLLNFPDSIVFGEPELIEFINGYFFIHDPSQTKTLTVFDEEGNYISQLKCQGSGPKEINNMELFTYNPFLNEVIIHERGKGFTRFNFPDFHFKKAIRGYPYLMSIKAIDRNTYALIEEADDDKIGKLLVVDTNFNNNKLPKIELPVMSSELSYPNTFSSGSAGLYYMEPNFENIFYSISSNNLQPLWKVNFGKDGVSKNLWYKYNYDNEIEEEITEKNKAAYLHHIAWLNDTIFAWFKYRTINDVYFAMIHPATQQTRVFSTLKLMKENIGFPFPVGVKENYFIGIPEELELLYKYLPDEMKKGIVGNIISQAIENNKTVILLYALKL
jgi:hypothetical protein